MNKRNFTLAYFIIIFLFYFIGVYTMRNTKLFISINSAITGFYMLSYFLIFGKNIFHLNNDKAIQLLKEKVYDKYMEETGKKRPLPQDYLFRTWLFEYEKKIAI